MLAIPERSRARGWVASQLLKLISLRESATTAGARFLEERDISPGDRVDLLSDNCQISPFIAQVYRSLENLYNEGYLNGVPFKND